MSCRKKILAPQVSSNSNVEVPIIDLTILYDLTLEGFTIGALLIISAIDIMEPLTVFFIYDKE